LSGDCKNIVKNSSSTVFGDVAVVSLFSIDAINRQFLERAMIRVEADREATLQRAPGTLQKAMAYVNPGANTMERILVVEDDHAVQKALRRLFETEGFEIEISTDGQAALEAFRRTAPAAIVLDLRLPLVSGRDVCREIKQQAPTLPIIVLSAASDVSDKVLLLELGADDYVTKPFSPRELLARVRAALRRTVRTGTGDVVTFAGISVDFVKMEVNRNGEQVVLTAQEFKTLKFLIQNAERVISRDELLNEVWGYQNYPSTRTVDNHILKLRQKLETDPTNPIHFRTVHGMGYKFVR
jgi:DNA-binding response OmpR family regulator